jgi:hypothetical protein
MKVLEIFENVDINSQPEDKQIEYVGWDGQGIGDITNPSEAVQLAAIHQDCWAIEYIEHPTEAAQLAAVEEDSNILEYLKNPSPTVVRAAILSKLNSGTIWNNYVAFVKKACKNNTILTNKWLRYGEVARAQK